MVRKPSRPLCLGTVSKNGVSRPCRNKAKVGVDLCIFHTPKKVQP